MSAESTDVIDRRDFVLSSLATVGASAALVNGTEAADGQTGATPVTTSQGSIYTGDVIQGKKVVTALDVGDLQPGQKHLLYFHEIGNSRILDLDKIPLFVEGTMNVLKHHGIITGPMGRTGKDSGVFVGNSAFPVLATQGGFVELLVKLNEKVKAGQKVAIQRNTFGEVVAEYTSGVAGEVGALRSDATSEPGNVLVFIIFNHAPPEGQRVYPE